ncbi:MAG: glycosyltransferase [Candidatus Latescibacterota bacterium]
MAWNDVLLGVTGAVYLAAIAWLWVGLRRGAAATSPLRPSVSVVVAARNEEAALDGCLEALRRQDYLGPWEVVVVDDRSTDATGVVAEARARDWGGLRLIRVRDLPAGHCPKKHALAAGIAGSTGEILLFTDADCRPPPGWVRSTVARFTGQVGLVAGYAYPCGVHGAGQRLLALDNLAVGALGRGSFGMGQPLSCSGRNLAYRRCVYDQVGGFASFMHLQGGDDVYLMRRVRARTRWGMVHSGPEAAVPCLPPCIRPGRLLQQKLRHAGKAGHYTGLALLLGASVWLFHAALAAGLVGMAWQGRPDPVVLGVWGARWLADGGLLLGMARPEERPLLAGLPLLEVVYIPYALIFTLAGRMGWSGWK